MSILLNKIAAEVASVYAAIAPTKTFFGFNLANVDVNSLHSAAKKVLNSSELRDFENFLENSVELKAKFDKEIVECNAEFAKRKADFADELVEAKAKFDHELQLKTISFDREQELKKLALAHDEKLFVTESGYTKEIIERELANAKASHDLALETEKTKFASELNAATELMKAELAHSETIANAEIRKAREESAILYAYDSSVLQKKLQAEVSDRFDELIKIAAQSESKDELIARLQADKDYFQNFAEARVERSEDVTDALVSTISDKAKTPVTVNVSSECSAKKAKKN